MLPNKATQSGSVMIYILLGIVLLAALFFTFSRQSGNSSGMAAKGNAKVQAQELINYAEQISRGIEKLLLKGVSESDISFEGGGIYTPASNYPNCTYDTCKVFNTSGGNVISRKPNVGPPIANAPGWFPAPGTMQVNSIRINNLGTAAPDLVLSFFQISKDTCIEVNKILGNNFLTNPPSGDPTTGPEEYKGSFPMILTLGDSNDSWASGKTAFCYYFYNTLPEFYVYQKVVIAR